MKRANLISGLVALAIVGTAGMAVAERGWGGDDRGGHGGKHRMEQPMRGPIFDFDAVDTNADGKITQEEMAAHAAARFATADTNGDGALSADELTAAAEARMAEERKTRAARGVERMLEHRDANGDGVLSQEEMQPKEAGRFFERLDRDGDGAVSKEEMAALQKRMEKKAFKRGAEE